MCKGSKKSIHDFEFVRMIGRGAFGNVYLIKKSQWGRVQSQDALSLNADYTGQHENEAVLEINVNRQATADS